MCVCDILKIMFSKKPNTQKLSFNDELNKNFIYSTNYSILEVLLKKFHNDVPILLDF